MSHEVMGGRSKNFDILWTIVGSDSVDVMRPLAWAEPATEYLFRYKTMFVRIPAAIGEVMALSNAD